MTFGETGQIIEGKIKAGTFVGKYSVNNPEVSMTNLVSDDNNMALCNTYVQYILPPSLPVLQFQ